MNWLDILLILILAINLLNGLRRGLIRSSFGLLAIIVSLFIALKGAGLGGAILQQINVPEPLASWLGFIILLLTLHFLINFLGSILHDFARYSFFMPANYLGGVLLGFIKGIIFILFIVVPIIENPFVSTVAQETLQQSTILALGQPLITTYSPLIMDVLQKNTKQWQEKNKLKINSTFEQRENKENNFWGKENLKKEATTYIIKTINSEPVQKRQTDF